MRVDRQKGSRILKKLKKELEAEDDDEEKKQELARKVHNAEVDVNYAIYYPLMKPYASLYPKSKKEKEAESDDSADGDAGEKSTREVDGPKGELAMRKTVEQAMAEGTLDALRNSKEGMPVLVPVKEKEKKTKQSEQTVKSKEKKMQEKLAAAKNRRERRALGVQAQEEAEESDGGFFE